MWHRYYLGIDLISDEIVSHYLKDKINRRFVRDNFLHLNQGTTIISK